MCVADQSKPKEGKQLGNSDNDRWTQNPKVINGENSENSWYHYVLKILTKFISNQLHQRAHCNR